MLHTRLRHAALGTVLGLMVAAVPASAMSGPPKDPTPPSSSSGGSSGGSTSPTPIPEPAAIGLFALGIAGAMIMRRRAKKKDKE